MMIIGFFKSTPHPVDEIGPTSPGSPRMSLWFHDPHGYRWELSVQNGARER
jgi:hypothetical protein